MKNNLVLSSFILVCMGISLVGSASQATKLPSEALSVIEGLPQKAITLDLILYLGLKNSDSFALVQSGAITKEVAVYQANAPFDYQFNSSVNYFHNKNKMNSGLAPKEISGNTYSLSMSKAFKTGTQFQVGLSNSYQDSSYDESVLPGGISSFFGETEYNESKFSLLIKQSLLKDSFGSSMRKKNQSAQLQSESVEYQIKEGAEHWASNFANQFYQTWLAKSNVKATQDNLSRQERLLRVTRLMLNRGTAERSDLLQVEASVLLSIENLNQAKQNLSDIWRSLVVGLKLPASWIDFDPVFIPMKLAKEILPSQKACSENEIHRIQKKLEQNASVMKLSKLLESSQKSLLVAQDDFKPDLSLNASWVSNEIDPDVGRSLSDATGGNNPMWSIGLGFSYSFDQSREKANYAQALSAATQAEIQKSQLVSQLQVNWINLCKNLDRLNEQSKQFRLVYEKQFDRAQLEEKRFQIGRVPLFNVIQAGSDVTQSELVLRKSEVDLLKTAWDIDLLRGHIQVLLSELVDQFQFFKGLKYE